MKDSNDRFATAQTNHLLQRIDCSERHRVIAEFRKLGKQPPCVLEARS